LPYDEITAAESQSSVRGCDGLRIGTGWWSGGFITLAVPLLPKVSAGDENAMR